MGTQVTVVEILPQILPAEDAEIAAHARKRFEKQGIEILTSTKVTRVEKKPDGVVATIEDSPGAARALEAERMISAVGVTGNVENLGLETLGVKIERGIIVADGMGRTNVPGIYAIGDVAGPPMLAHKAEHEGVLCVEAIKGLDPRPIDEDDDSWLHLLQSAGGFRWPHRGKSQGVGYLKSGLAAFLSSAMARRLRLASPRDS